MTADSVRRSLDLGCGENVKNPFAAEELYGIDIRSDLEKNIYKADLVIEAIPFPGKFFDYVTAHDFLEHIPRIIYAPTHRFPFIELLNEIYRVLKTHGFFLSITPIYPHPQAFADPTHVNYMTEHTFPLYFVQNWAAQYGWRGSFKLIEQNMHGGHLKTILQKQ